MIHYHGTPITPRARLLEMAGRHFCVSYAAPNDLLACLKIGQSVMMDNGAFSVYTRGEMLDVQGFFQWIEPHLGHPHWAVVPDVIGGTVDEQRNLTRQWPFCRKLGAPVWHLHLPLDYLFELTDEWFRVCIGSSAEYWRVGSDVWCRRMDQAFNALAKRGPIPWLHGLRMLDQAGTEYPLASADSVNVGRNFKSNGRLPENMAAEIDARNNPAMWRIREEQERLFQ